MSKNSMFSFIDFMLHLTDKILDFFISLWNIRLKIYHNVLYLVHLGPLIKNLIET